MSAVEIAAALRLIASAKVAAADCMERKVSAVPGCAEAVRAARESAATIAEAANMLDGRSA